MKKIYLILAAVVGMTFASCTSTDLVGDMANNGQEAGDGSIQFGFNMQNATRASIVGNAAADMLGKSFYVIGTKGTENTGNPSETLVFDNYTVKYGVNTAGTTESNTANWEYVGVTADANHVKLSPNAQTIKFWDYSTAQYDFHAFSTGTKAAVTGKTTSTIGDDEINVTKSLYGAGLAGGATAYTFIIPTPEALKGAYVTDIVTVPKTNYGKEVQLTFKNLGSKIRLAFYETVPGYSVKDVKFYTVDGTNTGLGTGTSATAALITADGTNGFFTKGTVAVSFPSVGTEKSNKANYKQASVNVTPVAPGSPVKYQTFGTLHNFQGKEGSEEAVTSYLGRNITEATFAGTPELDYYQVVFPVTAGSPLILRVDYTLVSTDGSGETINVYGAKAVVPSSYTTWQPNYAYTYIFKISDNSNGWTDTDATAAGLFPITFDAVVAEVKDASGEQTTVTTVATPSITTYQQGHTYGTNEYSKTTKGADNVVRKLYVQVMHNEGEPEAHPVGSTYASCPQPILSSTTAFLYKLNNEDATEAMVVDALENRTSELAADNVTGRNGLTLTKNSNITTVNTIVNGPDDKPITIAADHGNAAEINIASEGVTIGTYAFVYDYTNAAKTTKTFYQPMIASTGSTIANETKYITVEKLATIVEKTSGSEAANDDYIYFSKTTDGVKTTYSYYSVDGKTGNLPEGLLKVSKSSDLLTGNGSTTVVQEGDFIFNIYTRNTGKYAVKVIKVVA